MNRAFPIATLIAAALATCGCSTAQLAAKGRPDRIYHSAKPRDAVADCLLNRLAGNEFRIDRREEGARTLVSARQGLALTTYFLFTLSDPPGGGTDIEMRRANSVAPGLHNAETCF